jgi:hypothetical protein
MAFWRLNRSLNMRLDTEAWIKDPRNWIRDTGTGILELGFLI